MHMTSSSPTDYSAGFWADADRYLWSARPGGWGLCAAWCRDPAQWVVIQLVISLRTCPSQTQQVRPELTTIDHGSRTQVRSDVSCPDCVLGPSGPRSLWHSIWASRGISVFDDGEVRLALADRDR